MQKKYQVFVSSTYSDLKKERKKVQEALLMADCIPAGMEAFVAANEEQFEIIKKVIDLCDYYVLIIGGRYGSVSKQSGISYTEMEYDYAIEKGLPILVFAIDEKIKLQGSKRESDPVLISKLKQFREKAMSNRLASIWKDEGDLVGKVAISIMKAEADNARPGWIRGDGLNPTELLKQINELQTENKRLVDENVQLKQSLDEMSFDTNGLEFDNQKITIAYRDASSFLQKKDITLKEIFGFVSINMIKVAVKASAMEDLIAQSIGASAQYKLEDTNIAKRILNQFLELKLMKTKWVDDQGLYYGLTVKGEQIKNEMNLFKADVKRRIG